MMQRIALTLLTLVTLSLAAPANDLSSLANASREQVTKAAQADAKEYYARLKQQGLPINDGLALNRADDYAGGRAIERGLTDEHMATHYELSFHDVILFLIQEDQLNHPQKTDNQE